MHDTDHIDILCLRKLFFYFYSMVSRPGHQVIAGLALAQLTPKAKAEVGRLLAQEPGETLVTISTWADEHKTHPLRAGTTSTSHATVARLTRSGIAHPGNALLMQLSGKQQCLHRTLPMTKS